MNSVDAEEVTVKNRKRLAAFHKARSVRRMTVPAAINRAIDLFVIETASEMEQEEEKPD